MLRRIWTRQPQQIVEIDWSNPLTRGLTFAAIGGMNVDLVRKKVLAINGTPGKQGNPRAGVSAIYTADTQYHSIAPPASWLPGACTLLVVADWQSGYAVPIGQMTIGGSFAGNTWAMVAGGGLDLFRNGATYRWSTTTGHSTGLHTWAVRQNGSTGVAPVFTEDLTAFTSSVVNNGSPVGTSTNDIRIGAHSTGVTPNYKPFLTLAWSRYLTDAELRQLDLKLGNPWQIFLAPPRITFAPAATGDVNAPAAAFDWSWSFSGGAASATSTANAPAAAFTWAWEFTGGAASTGGTAANAPGADFTWTLALSAGAASVTANPSAPGAALGWNWAFSGGAASVPGTGTLPQVVLYVGDNLAIGTNGQPVVVLFV